MNPQDVVYINILYSYDNMYYFDCKYLFWLLYDCHQENVVFVWYLKYQQMYSYLLRFQSIQVYYTNKKLFHGTYCVDRTPGKCRSLPESFQENAIHSFHYELRSFEKSVYHFKCEYLTRCGPLDYRLFYVYINKMYN